MELVLVALIYFVALFVILAFNYGAHKNDHLDEGSSPDDAPEALVTLVADDDFLEHLHEMGFEDTIDIEEAIIEWYEWAAENVE